jgi:hypothetical protein
LVGWGVGFLLVSHGSVEFLVLAQISIDLS